MTHTSAACVGMHSKALLGMFGAMPLVLSHMRFVYCLPQHLQGGFGAGMLLKMRFVLTRTHPVGSRCM